jgi:HEAT repeat protein
MEPADREALIDALASADFGRRTVALTSLEASEQDLDDELVGLLVALLGESNKQLSRRAAGLLSRAVEGERARALVVGALDAPSPLQRWGAAFTLASAEMFSAEIGVAALDALALDDGDIRWAAAGIVRAVAERDGAFLGRLERTAEESSGDQRKMCLYCLRDLGHTDPRVYLAALDAADVGTRHAALSGLQACGEPEPATLDGVVARLAAESDPGVRRSLAIVLGRIGGSEERAVAALRAAAEGTDDADFRRAVELVLREH